LAVREDIDTVIEEVAKDTEDEANKIAAEEATNTAAEEAGKGPTGEGLVDDQPSSLAASGSGK